MKKYFQYLFLLIFTSCASHEKTLETKIYSDDTNRSFEMIERGGSYYLKQAPANNPPPQIEVPIKKPLKISETQEEIVIDENINYHEKAQVLRPVLRNTQSISKADERLIEINQNLAFYCMKHRNSRAYRGDEDQCMKYVNTVMSNCQKQHRIVNSKLLNCIQKKLKK